jgi:putative ABC transport system substrate-binding protein
MLVNPGTPNSERDAKAVQQAAGAQGIGVSIVLASREAEFASAFAMLAGVGVGALFVESDAYFESHRGSLVTLAARHALPAIYDTNDYTEAGGLVSYGADFSRAYRQAGIYVGRILSGARPADLPVVQLEGIRLAINLKTAKTLGLAIPQSILARADEVIE